MIVRVDHVDLENRGSGRMFDDDWNHTGLDPNSDRFEASRVSFGERGCDRKLMDSEPCQNRTEEGKSGAVGLGIPRFELWGILVMMAMVIGIL
jgi:hypothetical protein